MTRLRWTLVAAIVLLSIGVMIPFQTAASPAIEIRLVDTDGKPVVGTRVQRFWFFLGSQRPNWRISDAAGVCRFPREYVEKSVAARISFRLESFFLGALPTPFSGRLGNGTVMEVLQDRKVFQGGHVEDCAGNRLNLPTTGHSPGVSLVFEGADVDRCFRVVLKPI